MAPVAKTYPYHQQQSHSTIPNEMVVYSGVVKGVRGERQSYQEYTILPDPVFGVQPNEVVGLWRPAKGPIQKGARCAWTWGSGPPLSREAVTILHLLVESP